MGRRWQSQRKKEYYYRKAIKENYRSRAAFKLIQINERFRIIKEGDVVIDFGANPGGWSQVALELVGDSGLVIGMDLKPIEPIENIVFLRADVKLPETKEKVQDLLNGRKADTIISDMSPNISGNYSTDHARSMELAEISLDYTKQLLSTSGSYVVKLFDGDMTKAFVEDVKTHFRRVKRHSPQASRSSSSEIYVIAKGYHK